MKAKEMRNKSSKELQKDLMDTRSKLASAQVDSRTKEVKNVRQIRAMKRDIARIMTIAQELEMTKSGEKS